VVGPLFDNVVYLITRRRTLATRRTAPSKPQQASLTIDQMKQGVERLKLRIADLEAFDPTSVQQRWAPEVKVLETAIEESIAAVFGHGTVEYNRYRGVARLDHGPVRVTSDWIAARSGGLGYSNDLREVHRYLTEGKQQSLLLLRQAVRGLEEEIRDREELATASTGGAETAIPIKSPAHNRKVFVVHGREEGPREAVARFLERLGFQPIILHEQANQGRTVIEKVEDHSDVGFAVIILTPDDMGNLKGEEPQPRARQNVLLELGYFIGKLTRKRVCTLKVGELEIPSDWRGVVDEPYDAGGGWRQTLARELEAAEYEIDWNRVMRP
jgi:predicted nucleotide-binding protein